MRNSTTTLPFSPLSLFYGSLEMAGIGLPSTLMSFFSSLILIPFFFLFLAKYKAPGKEESKSAKPFSSFPLPPGPKPWPIVGCLPELCQNRPGFRWIERLMEKMNTEIICIKLGKTHVITVTNPEIACEFLKKQDANFSSRPVCVGPEVTTDNYLTTILSPMGDQWKKMRKVLASEILSTARHRLFQGTRTAEADHLVGYVYNQCKNSVTGGLVNVRLASQHYCGNVIKQMVFSRRFFGKGMPDGGPGEEEEEHIDAVFLILDLLYTFCVSDFLPSLRCLDIDGHEKAFRKAAASIRKYQDPIIDERLQQWMDGTRRKEEDLLDVMVNLKNADGKPLLSGEEIKAQIIELMIATVDNPSNAFEWALGEMLNRPELFKKAIEELDTVVGKERLVQESDLPQLRYVKACAREAFRLHPIAPHNVPHVSDKDTTVTGYFIPKGSHVVLSRPGLGRNPKFWDEPLKYIPERHLKEHALDVPLNDPELRVFSFSTGRRGCPGVVLGSAITAMLFARLLQGFTWSLPPGISSVELVENVGNLFMVNPLHAIAKPRLAENLYPVV